MDAELLTRIHRMNVAIGRVNEHDVQSIPAKIFANDKHQVIVQDFSGGKSEAEISETLHGLIANVASFHDHLQKWSDRHGVSRESIHNFLKDSFDFCVVRDLWNNDKHGYPPHNDGWSKKAPRLTHANSICELTTGTETNSSATMTLGLDGKPNVFTTGGGSVRAVLTGEIIDKNGGGLEDAHRVLERAVRVCESAVERFVNG